MQDFHSLVPFGFWYSQSPLGLANTRCHIHLQEGRQSASSTILRRFDERAHHGPLRVQPFCDNNAPNKYRGPERKVG